MRWTDLGKEELFKALRKKSLLAGGGRKQVTGYSLGAYSLGKCRVSGPEYPDSGAVVCLWIF